MKLGLFALPAALLLTFAALIAGCGGGADALTLDEYFQQFEAIDADVDAQIEAAFADYPEDVSDEEFFADDANLPFFKDLIAAFPRITRDSLDRVKNLEPPSEVEDAHNDLVAALENLLITFEEAAEVLGAAETMAEAFELNAEVEPSIDAATARFDTACLALVVIASTNGIAVDLSCEDGE